MISSGNGLSSVQDSAFTLNNADFYQIEGR